MVREIGQAVGNNFTSPFALGGSGTSGNTNDDNVALQASTAEDVNFGQILKSSPQKTSARTQLNEKIFSIGGKLDVLA